MGGTFLMYYTVRDTALAMQCISVATSDTPVGPFVDLIGVARALAAIAA
jgi:hypothetical protein